MLYKNKRSEGKQKQNQIVPWVIGNGATWGNNKKKQSKRFFIVKKNFKLIKKTSEFFHISRLIYDINLIALGSLKTCKATQKLFLM